MPDGTLVPHGPVPTSSCLPLQPTEAQGFGDRPLANLRFLLVEMAAVVTILALIWGSIGFVLWREHANAEAQGYEITGNLTRAFEETTARTISEIDQTLLSARASYALEGDKFDVVQWARSQRVFDRMTVQIGLADPTGYVFDTTLGRMKQPVNIRDREHFLAQQNATDDRLFISRPVTGRGSGRQTIQFSRKLLRPDGSFGGVVVLSLGCEALSEFYDTLGFEGGYVGLVKLDGILLARGPFLEGAIGHDLSGTPMFHLIRERTSDTLHYTSRIDGIPRVVSFRRLHGYPVAVLVGLSDAAIFAPFHRLQIRLVIGGIAASALLLLFSLAWLHQRGRSVENRRSLMVTLGAISQGILMIERSGRIPVVNQRAIDLLGLGQERSAEAAGRNLLARIAAAESEGAAKAGGDDRIGFKRFDHHCDDGRIVEIECHMLQTGGAVVAATDVTEQRHAESRIRYVANHDFLTGLPNRLMLKHCLFDQLAEDAGRQEKLAFILIDLDGFKEVNDTLGHAAGDGILIEMGRRLRTLISDDGLVVRVGGDEFLVVLRDCPDEQLAVRTAQAVLECLSVPAIVGGQQVRIEASAGLAFYPQDGGSGDAVMRHADIALYQAKATGRSCYRRFEQPMMSNLLHRRTTAAELREAIKHEQLDLHFQPQASCEDLTVVGFEALVRWRHPERGAISPAVFIPIAEETQHIIELGRWVMRKACAEAARWPQGRVAVNVSPAQLRDAGFLSDLNQALAASGLPPHRLEVEITESVLIKDGEEALRTLRALKERGIGIALDDFGTGYSSLSYLRHFPLDKIKVDRSFVEQLPNDPVAQGIMEAIVLMGCHLGLKVVAEGVETQQQLAIIRKMGCTEVQGYLIDRPLPAEDARRLVRGRAPRDASRMLNLAS